MEHAQLHASEPIPEHAATAGSYHIFMLVKTTRNWLDLPTPKRIEFFRDRMLPILKQRPQVSFEQYECEAFHAEVTDIFIWKTTDLNAWVWIADHLRETEWWDHHVEVVSILPAIRADYQPMIDAL